MIKIYFSTITNFEHLHHIEKLCKTKKNLIPKQKMSKILKIKKTEDRIIRMYASLLFRMLLYKDFNIPLNSCPIAYNQFGYPYFPNVNNLFFNFSYSKNIFVCAISDDCIGIDIEQIEQSIDTDILELFHPIEQKYINSFDKKNQLIIKYWNLKESYLKFLGVGLSKDLNSFFVNEYSNNLYNIWDNGKSTSAIKNYTIKNNYFLSVCSKIYNINNICIEEIEPDDVLDFYLKKQ